MELKSVDTLTAAKEIVGVLAAHEIPISLIDVVFFHAKSIAVSNSFVQKLTLNQEERE